MDTVATPISIDGGEVDANAVIEGTPIEATPAPSQPLLPPSQRKTIVWYQSITDVTRDQGFLFFDGVPDLRTQKDIELVSEAIKSITKADRIIVTGWRGLEG